MSYKALYRTYRPKGFEDVVGQDHIISTLQNVISQNKVGHAYLFSGPRGTGKTSVAHVFAREVNRNGANQVVAHDLDIIELDAASNNGVSEIRAVIDGVRYSPTESKFKVYIIDEVHMLTKGAFNALLKTLEEPPLHVIFILATTEAHKIPVTILSRVQRFNFRRIDEDTIKSQLRMVLDKEEIKYDDESLRFIAKLSQGGMRDALSIADQAAAYGNGSISFSTISQVFGVISVSNQIDLINNAFVGNAREVLTLSNRFIENGADIERLSSSLIDIVKDYVIYKKTEDQSLLGTMNVEEVNELNISINFAYEALDVFMKLVADLKYSHVPHQTFELALLKITKSDKLITVATTQTPSHKIVETQSIKIKETPIEKVQLAPKKEEKVIIDEKIFKTDEIFVQDENTGKVIDDEELEKTAEMLIEQRQEEVEQLVEEEKLLSTSEIPVGEIRNVEKNTEEIDLVSMFSIADTDELPVRQNKTNDKVAAGDIINLLVQADRELIALAKTSMLNIGFKAVDAKSSSYVAMLDKTKLISVGKEFILLSSDDNAVVAQVNRDRKVQSFIDFTNEVFGRPLLVFAITKDEFAEIKQLWNELSSSNELPAPRPIEQVRVSEKKKTEQEAFGESLFNELFVS